MPIESVENDETKTSEIFEYFVNYILAESLYNQNLILTNLIKRMVDSRKSDIDNLENEIIINKEKIAFSRITGETTAQARIDTVKKFWDDVNTPIFLGNPAAAGMGLNLQIAHLEVYMANWYRPDVRSQSEDRLHRHGQKNPVTVIDIVAKHTIENKILNTLISKIEIENQILTINELRGE